LLIWGIILVIVSLALGCIWSDFNTIHSTWRSLLFWLVAHSSLPGFFYAHLLIMRKEQASRYYLSRFFLWLFNRVPDCRHSSSPALYHRVSKNSALCRLADIQVVCLDPSVVPNAQQSLRMYSSASLWPTHYWDCLVELFSLNYSMLISCCPIVKVATPSSWSLFFFKKKSQSSIRFSLSVSELFWCYHVTH